jgi:xylan 1,4-beta-xylosidase
MRITNPVLPGMHPDPSVCRVRRDFYLACSSFEYFPGVPIFHSRDLVHWRQIGSALTRRSQLDLAGAPSSGGIYAPTLRHHNGVFFLVTTHIGRGHLLVTTRDPRRAWSEPQWLDGDGFDPSLTFAEGRVYLTWAGSGRDAEHPFVYQRELDSARKARVIWRGTGGVWTEGPHLFRRGGWWYLVTAEGGTSYDHAVVVARARGPYGPFRASPHGPLLTHRDRPRDPIQAAGHADLVELEDGTTWAVLLAVRPSAGRHHHLGRETFLAPVEWREDGWPRMAPLELRLDAPTLPSGHVRDDGGLLRFDRTTLPSGWLFVRNPVRGGWSLRERPGFLRLKGNAATLADTASPALVCRRQQHLDVTVRTRLRFEPRAANEQAGLCVRASEEFHVALVVTRGERGRELLLVRTLAGRTTTIGRSPLGPGAVTLELRATAREYGFAGGSGRTLVELGRVPTRSLSAETILARTGRPHFTGAVVGLYATGSGRRADAPADFDWVRYEPLRARGRTGSPSGSRPRRR